LDFHIFAIYVKIQISAYFYVDVQNLVKKDDTRPSYYIFSIFKMAAVRLLGFGMTS